MKTHVLSVAVGALVCSLANMQIGSDSSRLATLSPEQAEILTHLSIVYLDDGEGGTAKTIRVEGVNLQIVNGLGATNGNPEDPLSVDRLATEVNGVGNLIVGYNESGFGRVDSRTGSHNIVHGIGNGYSSFGGTVGGRNSGVTGPCAAVLAGNGGVASGADSAVLAGGGGRATGARSAIVSGLDNEASGVNTAVVAGDCNFAVGSNGVVLGGFSNTANSVSFALSTVVCGGTFNSASGETAVVVGGSDNSAPGSWAVVGGGRENAATGNFATTGGGALRTASGADDWVAGSLFEDD